MRTASGATAARAPSPAETESWRVAPPGTGLMSFSDVNPPTELLIQGLVSGADHYNHPVHLRVTEKRANGPAQDRFSAGGAVLFWAPLLKPGPHATACRYDKRRITNLIVVLILHGLCRGQVNSSATL